MRCSHQMSDSNSFRAWLYNLFSFMLIAFVSKFCGTLNTERTYKWKLSGSARQSEIGILCFDWLIHPGVSYSREI